MKPKLLSTGIIGLCFMVSTERARQIYNKGIRKLRTTKNIELINNASEKKFSIREMQQLKGIRNDG